jgi:peptidoglycan hydrolase-like protein with peptidoglycan-binding domain
MGDRGLEVLALQKDLNRLGYDLIEDGIFGPGTYHVVIDFQMQYGLFPDGIVGSKTMSKIKQMASNRGVRSLQRSYETLSLGTRSRSVQIAQKFLNRYGFELVEDGVFTKVMLQALLDYQKALHLEESGLVDEATWRSLRNKTKHSISIVRTHPVSMLGDRNEEVYHLQACLKLKGFDVEMTNYFGMDMLNSVKKLQEESGLEVTGVVDAQTRKLIVDEV